ncbi:MAG: Hint domain-containing protein [Rhodobacter sp.]|nr:Hint domain-containing protein [Rhodobacter sp.]
MPKKIVIWEFANYTTVPNPISNLTTATYVSGDYSGAQFTFDGGTPIEILIDDDDDDFEDAYVETGGPQTLAAPVTVGSTTYPVGTVVQNEFSMIDGNGNEYYVVRLGPDNVGIAYQVGDDPFVGESFTVVSGRDGAPADSDDGVSSSEPYVDVICFRRGTRILTPAGPRRVEQLAPGDQVTTRDAGAQPLRWTGARRVAAEGRFAPVRIDQGVLGNTRPLWLSPQHRVLVTGWRAELLFGEPAVLVAARDLIDDSRVRRRPGGEIDYVHLLFDDHQIVFAEGAPVESLHPGAVGLTGMHRGQRNEILSLFPELAHDYGAYGPSAYPALKSFEARLLTH